MNSDNGTAASLPRPGLVKRLRLGHASRENQQRCEQHALRQLFWECTLRCNLHCLHCGSDCRTASDRHDMPLADFLAVLDDVRTAMNPDQVLVITTGGEPLVRQDICACGRAIRARGFHWGMVSNGLLLDEKKCDELLHAGLETIAISLDGFEDEHNWLRGNKRSFAMAARAIKVLVNKKITWDVITCVNQKNYGSLDTFKQYLINIGVRNWRVITIAPMGRAAQNDGLQLNREQFRSLMDYIVKVRKEGQIRVSYGCEGFLGDYEWKVRDYPFFCQAGVNIASVLADGSISGCLSIRSHYHQGNIYADRFTDVWDRRFELYRNRTWMQAGPCATCDMWTYCQGNGLHLRDDNGTLLLCHYRG